LEIARFYDQLTRRLAVLPGVQAAAAGSDLPWTGHDDNAGFSIEGRSSQANDSVHARYHVASADYFRALGIPLVRGRHFSERDTADAPATLLINQGLAHRYWPNGDAVGKRVTFASNPAEKDWVTIVGIVGDVKDAPDKAAAEPAFWWPLQQQPFGFAGMVIAIRASSSSGPLAEQLRTTVRELNPNLAISDVRLMDQIAGQALSTQRLSMCLVGLFAVLAVSLAAIGIYGVISYSVSQRTHEFGLRMALGAGQWDVLRLVLIHGLKLSVVGVGLGLAGALAFARVMRTLLYEVSSVDPLTFSMVPVMAVLVATLACYLPARRATRSDPLESLRAE
jgi:predicted permease